MRDKACRNTPGEDVDGRLGFKRRAERRFIEEVRQARQHAARECDASEGDKRRGHVPGEAPDDAPE